VIELRSGRADEAGTLLAIQRAAALSAFAHIFSAELHPFPDDAIRERWDRALGEDQTEVLVAERRDDPVGVVAFSHEWLESLYVVPSAQREGVGSRLHDEALSRRREAGDAVCRLWTLEQNDRGRRFYERRGWQLDGRSRTIPFPPHPLDVGYSLRIPGC